MTVEEIEKEIKGMTEFSRAFKFDFNSKELAENIGNLMQNGLTFDDAQKVASIKVMARFASRFQGLHAEVIPIEEYSDEKTIAYIESLNTHLVGLEADLGEAVDSFCADVFGDRTESTY